MMYFTEDENMGVTNMNVYHSDTIAKKLPRLATPEDYEDEDLYMKMTKQFYVHTYYCKSVCNVYCLKGF